MSGFDVETGTLQWGYKMTVDRIAVRGSDPARGLSGAARMDDGTTAPERRLRDAFARLDSNRPAMACDDAVGGSLRSERTNLDARSRAFRCATVDRVPAERHIEGGAVRGAQGRVVDFNVAGKPDTHEARVDTVSEAGIPEAAGQASMRRASGGATATL